MKKLLFPMLVVLVILAMGTAVYAYPNPFNAAQDQSPPWMIASYDLKNANFTGMNQNTSPPAYYDTGPAMTPLSLLVIDFTTTAPSPPQEVMGEKYSATTITSDVTAMSASPPSIAIGMSGATIDDEDLTVTTTIGPGDAEAVAMTEESMACTPTIVRTDYPNPFNLETKNTPPYTMAMSNAPPMEVEYNYLGDQRSACSGLNRNDVYNVIGVQSKGSMVANTV